MRSKLLSTVLVAVLAFASTAFAGDLARDEVNKAEFTKPSAKNSRAVILKAQVLLDRLSFSSGAIDGRRNDNYASALRAFQQQNGLNTGGELDAATWKKLTESPEPALIEYTISAVDTKGPFAEEIPESYEKKAELEAARLYRAARAHRRALPHGRGVCCASSTAANPSTRPAASSPSPMSA